MDKRLTTILLVVALTAGLAAPAAAGKWKLLGEKRVSDAVDRDVIRVTAARGQFSAIRIAVFDRAVQFRDVEVHFANGTKQEVELRSVIAAGKRSRVIDLKGDDRVIASITLLYDAQSLRGKPARVKVFGRR